MAVSVKAIEDSGVLPVINIPDPDVAVPLAKAILDGGISCLEVTLRSSGSLEAIRRIKEAYPDMLVGAGTVLSIETVDTALAAGADYIVSPGFDEKLVDYCIGKGVLIVPGCATPSEIQAGVEKGLEIIKFFPAELSGGVDAIKLISGPFPKVKFLPTGGINFGNLGRYLECGKVIACGGSYMATADQVKNRDFEGITAACKRCMDISLGFELAHVGVNASGEDDAASSAETVSDIFRLSPRYMNSAVFAGVAVEFVKSGGLGEKGHIGFKTNSVKRAIAYFEKKGIKLNENSIKRNAAGEITCIYLEDEFNGFAYHVVAK